MRLLHRESVLRDRILKLLERDRVSGLQLHCGHTLFQADLDRRDSIHRHEGHAHGVCTDLSIHAENLDVYGLYLGGRRGR